MALHCVRNTVIETYHAADKLTNADMKAFNQEVVNKQYSFLQFVLDPRYAAHYSALRSWFYLPSGWDSPQLDPDFAYLLERTYLMNRVERRHRKPTQKQGE